ncbi:MAG: hypothetical protein J6Y29_02710 [Clostridiales bacterium]|nr:hypothetical protein [Clostridiales bacterium]
MISKEEHAKNLVNLDLIKRHMEELNFATHLVEKSEDTPLNMLLVNVGQTYNNEDRILNFNYIPLPDDMVNTIDLLQITSVIPMTYKKENKSIIEKLLLEINTKLAVGNFILGDNETIMFRYIYVTPKLELIRKEELKETAMLCVYMLEIFTETIDKVSQGEMTLAEAIKSLG